MAELLASTASITSEIEKLINDSRGEKIILVTPYLKIARQFRDTLKDQVKFNTKITVIVREGESHDPADISFLQESGISLHTHQNLHAKCYLNHKTAIITSMNLSDYSQLNNTEMGLKVTSEHDPKLYHEINEAVKKIVRNSHEFQFGMEKVGKTAPDAKTDSSTKHRSESRKTTRGFCIRCGAEIPLNPDKPLCFRCFPGWAKFSDPTYPEKFCHVCGKESKQSLDKPVCYSCYKNLYK